MRINIKFYKFDVVQLYCDESIIKMKSFDDMHKALLYIRTLCKMYPGKTFMIYPVPTYE